MAVIRDIRKDDMPDILEISKNVWGGHDYLPRHINDWLKDPDCHTFGTEVDGKLIAIANLRVIDGGNTAWFEGLRVHPNHREQGYANRLTDHLVEVSHDIGVERVRYTTAKDNVESLALAKRIGLEKILEMYVFWKGDLLELDWSYSEREVLQVSPRDVQELLEENVFEFLHPVIIHDWKAWEFTDQSLQDLGQKCCYYLSREKDAVTGLSVGGIRKEADSDQWSFTVYATNEEAFLSHLSFHLDLACDQQFDAVMCIAESAFESTIESLPWFTDDIHGTRIILFNKEL
ncbi:GNAT family N-acetyltransferase [Candidatus Thorarchaeota archaeon]|nr:MAG: GNAT family N-acetyltransferase [Candidatus Thorarchaeota archaeon]